MQQPPPSPPASQPGFPPSQDLFTGTFSNGQMTLQIQGANGSYSGHLSVGNEGYPVVLRQNGNRLEGNMNAANGQYGFYLTASQSGVEIDSAGEIFSLARVAQQTGPYPQQPGGFPQQPAPAPGAQPGMPQGAPQSAPQGPPQGTGDLPPGVTENSPLAQEWRQHLAGKKVTYMSSYSSNTLGGGGFTQKNIYHLCSDGRFAFSEDGAIALNPGEPDLGTPGSAGRGRGSWRILTQGQLAGIELRFDDGSVVHYQLTMQDGATYANQDRVYVTPGEICY